MDRPTSACSRRNLLALAALPLVWSVSGCGRDGWASLPTTEVTIATGNEGGVFASYGDALAQVLERRLSGVTASSRRTDASVENLQLVADGLADIGFTLADAAADAVRGHGVFDEPLDVLALTRLYDSVVHLVVLADSGITRVTDLRGRRVGLGAAASGTRVLAERILDVSRVSVDEVEVLSYSLRDGATALLDGRVDAFFFVSGTPNQTVTDLRRQAEISLVDLPGVSDEIVGRYGPGYAEAQLPASRYGLRRGTVTVSLKNHLVVSSAMDDEVAYAVTRILFDRQNEIDRAAEAVVQPSLAGGIYTSPLELHPGAMRFFRERA